MSGYFLIVFFGVLERILAIRLSVGDCPIVYEEICDSQLVKFSLDSSYGENSYQYPLDPFKPILPREFNILTPLKVLIHGYGGLNIDFAIKNVSKAYRDVGYNVITVNWNRLSALPCYLTAVLNTWHVAQCISLLLVSLIPFGLDPYFVHIVGFSLGAHIAGFTGSTLKKSTGHSVHRITGLDPALPFFATLKNEWKLDASDASFVDVIHTSAGVFGKIETLGHVDFYVNGGTLQPYCNTAKNPVLCSHLKAGNYFAESVLNPQAFIGIKCENLFSYLFAQCQTDDRVIMGEHIDFKSRGTYFVNTSDKSQYPEVITFI